VADHHHRRCLVGQLVDALEQLGSARTVESGLDEQLDIVAEGRRDRLEGLARPPGGRAQHERRELSQLAQVLTDEQRGAPAARRERTVVVGTGRVVPARLRVPKQRQVSVAHVS
jgi:hypothetical protein